MRIRSRFKRFKLFEFCFVCSTILSLVPLFLLVKYISALVKRPRLFIRCLRAYVCMYIYMCVCVSKSPFSPVICTYLMVVSFLAMIKHCKNIHETHSFLPGSSPYHNMWLGDTHDPSCPSRPEMPGSATDGDPRGPCRWELQMRNWKVIHAVTFRNGSLVDTIGLEANHWFFHV
jgi:hypothetical protein